MEGLAARLGGYERTNEGARRRRVEWEGKRGGRREERRREREGGELDASFLSFVLIVIKG